MYKILSLFIFLYSCTSDPSLIGHWHAEVIYPTKDGVPSTSVFTFDVVNDTLLSVWSNPPFWAGQPGYHDGDAQTFNFGAECIATAWSYTIESFDQLSAHDLYSDYAKQITLTRKDDCTIESHLFLESRLSIRLPEAIPGAVELTERALMREYTIGPASDDYIKYYPGPFRYQLGDKIITQQDTGYLELYELQHLVKLPEAKRDQTKVVVYADASTSAAALNEILNYYFRKGNDTIYFAMLKRGRDTTFLRYLPVPVLSPEADEHLTVEAWLNTKPEYPYFGES